MRNYLDFAALVGLTMASVTNDGDEIVFTTDEGAVYALYHEQDCCEYVRVEDVAGDLDDLVGSPILLAEEVSNDDQPTADCSESCTWTFYKVTTNKGSVTIRFLGESNGYYSEGVTFCQRRAA